MKKYKVTSTGEQLMANTPHALVDLLNRTSRAPSASPQEFMRDYAKRSVMTRDLDIRATDFQSFVEDLIAAGDLMLLA